MKLLYDVENARWYNENGESFSSDNPTIPYGNSERVQIQLYAEVKGANTGRSAVNDWVKYTGFSGSGYGAILATDNNFLHWFKAKLATALSAGSVAEGTLICVSTSESVDSIAETGNIYLYGNSGNEALAYSARTAITGGIQFTAAAGNVLTNSYAADAQTDIPEMLYAEAAMVSSASDPANGLFTFDFVCDSSKLRNKMQYSSVEKVDDCEGLELTIFQIQSNNTISIRKRFRCTTFRITGGIADVKTGVAVPVPEQSTILSLLNGFITQGMDVQLYNSTSQQWENYSSSKSYTSAYTKFRIRLTSAGTAADWAVIPLLCGTNGEDGEDGVDGVDGVDAPNVKIQYSADNSGWHDTFSSATDKYVRFSTDNGSTYSSGMKFIGDNAPNVKIQYSTTGGSGSWHDTLAAGDYYVHFSVDNGTTYTGAMQIVAYAVKFTYGSTATADFHAGYVSGVDKYFKMSADNGATWTDAMLFCGSDGQSFVPDATGTYANRTAYDDEETGFAYLVTSGDNAGKIYFKISATSADWSSGLQFTPNGLTLQYSADGTSWHTTQANSDYYIRFSTDSGTTWSTGGRYQGTSAYCYYAYASDSAGNDFALAPASTLVYRNEIHTAAVYSSGQLTAARFAAEGIGWYKHVGTDGTTIQWLSGSTAPAAATGNNGDWYLNTSNCDVFQKVSGSWVNKLNIKGTPGTNGEDGEDGVDAPLLKIQYSSDNSSWHDTFTAGDYYIRFSNDNGSTYGSGMKFIGMDGEDGEDGTNGTNGTNAPQMMIQFSADGSSWHTSQSDSDNYIRFSVDGGSNWTNGGRYHGLDGEDGEDGTDGTNGTNGTTPTINPQNKHWMLGDTDTGVCAEGTGSATLRLQLVKPQDGLHLFIKKAGSDGTLANATTLIDTATVAADRSKVKAFLASGSDGSFQNCPADGFGSPYDGAAVTVDLSELTTLPATLFYCWKGESSSMGDYHALIFPCCGAY